MKNSLGQSYIIKLKTHTPLHIGSGNYLSSKSDLLNENHEIKNQKYVTNSSPIEISEFVKSNNRVFIPGSSLKGAIRTALLYDWLRYDGIESLKEWLHEIRSVVNDKNFNFKKRAEVIHKGSKDRRYKGFINIIENNCFGNFRNMANLKISDSEFVEDSKTLIYELRRYFLTSDYNGIPTFCECIIPNIETKFTLNAGYLYKNQHFKGVFFELVKNHFNSTDSIIRLLNNHAKALLDYELSVFIEDEIVNEEIEAYKDLIKSIKNEIETNKTAAYVRLGAGKMQFHQTVAVSIVNLEGKNEKEDDWISECWENYKSYINNFPKEEVEFPYPKTRILTAIGQLPLGWVKLEF